MTDQQKEFIWLAHGECLTFDAISKILKVDRKEISKWEVEFKKEWEPIAEMRKVYTYKKITIPLKEFNDWYQKMQVNKKCCYCNITEEEIAKLIDKDLLETKRSRGKKLELDRKVPNNNYDDLENIVYSCYWCNNAKTDTFNYDEFKRVGEVFKEIWQERLSTIK